MRWVNSVNMVNEIEDRLIKYTHTEALRKKTVEKKITHLKLIIGEILSYLPSFFFFLPNKLFF